MGHDFVNLTQILCFLIKYMQVQLFGLYNIDDWQGYDVYIYIDIEIEIEYFDS